MMHFGMHCGHINNYWAIANMNLIRPLVFFIVLISSAVFALQSMESESPLLASLPKVGSWIFSGLPPMKMVSGLVIFFKCKNRDRPCMQKRL